MTYKRILGIVAVTSLAACSALSACARSSPVVPTPAPSGGSSGPPVPGYRLAWQDGFDGDTLDTSAWTAQNAARRDATNTAAAVSVAGGVLTITTYTDGGRHYTGATRMLVDWVRVWQSASTSMLGYPRPPW
jgi:hypothetical protein